MQYGLYRSERDLGAIISTIWLISPFRHMIRDLSGLLALTENPSAIHESIGFLLGEEIILAITLAVLIFKMNNSNLNKKVLQKRDLLGSKEGTMLLFHLSSFTFS